MPVTITTIEEQARDARRRRAIRAWRAEHPPPGLDDQPCRGCGAAPGRMCPRTKGRPATRCAERRADYLAACDRYRAAAQEAGRAAAGP